MPPVLTENSPPHVPNHEMVRVIGRGSYGEIWLARSVTGTWRAVKIVDRRRFESEKAFQREFEGMAKFEPISRSDDGFVDILHVGRDPGGDFFFYVMELADDHLGGEGIEPELYVPKTLKAELGRRSRLLVDECLTIGLSLTRALGVLHRKGLVHRDIKPANVIFVGGTPKIADIGLVAASGQLSYVGTEGYVPPEGPGSVQADIYSLGKVLYEIAMGKDRLDFPALNTRLDEMPDKEALLRLNEVLLRACASEPAERYASVEEMHEDLVRLRDGCPLVQRKRARWRRALVGALLLALASAGGSVAWLRSGRGSVAISTDPPGAMVALGGELKRTPAIFKGLKPGRHNAHVMLAGYDPVDAAVDITRDSQTELSAVRLQRSHGSLELSASEAVGSFQLLREDAVAFSGALPAKIELLPTGEYELVAQLDGRDLRERIEIRRNERTTRALELATGTLHVTSDPPGAEIRVDGREVVAPVELALPEGAHEVVARFRNWPEQRKEVAISRGNAVNAAFEFLGGSVKITSAPGGASVFVGDEELGRTPLPIEDLPPGKVEYELRLAGFKPLKVSGTVSAGEQTFLAGRFVSRAGPRRGEPWENSLGMKFLPLDDVLLAIWPVRVRDFDAFCSATSRARLVADFPQDESHPAVRVNWEDASEFCKWLSEVEEAAEQLEDGQFYRLPTDAEWSAAAGLAKERGETPEQRDGKSRDFPWGRQWPPPAGAGNYADAPLKRPGMQAIGGYVDGFAQTAPVGRFPPNARGFHDMGGNVWQWCLEPYKPGSRWGVLRGGSWATASQSELRTAYRMVVDRGERDVIYGFRCVLVPASAE